MDRELCVIFMLCLFTNMFVLFVYDCVVRAIMIYNVVLLPLMYSGDDLFSR